MEFVKNDIDSLKITLGKMKIQNYVSKSTEKLKKQTNGWCRTARKFAIILAVTPFLHQSFWGLTENFLLCNSILACKTLYCG